MSYRQSVFQKARAEYRPRMPEILGGGNVVFEEGGATESVGDVEAIRERFPRTFGRPQLRLTTGPGLAERRPLNVGVVLSGGQAPGGHNVLAGLFDALTSIHAGSRLYGFLGGPGGF